MHIAKSEVQHLLNKMPEECNVEELHYRLYVLEKIKRGQDAIAQAQTLSHEEVKNRMAKKWLNQ